jgi:putative ABC transport system ATP-binding protein
MLSVQQLQKSYQAGDTEQVVFDRLDLDVTAGQVVALLGASGSGKTTLLNLLSGIDRPDGGRVLIAGTDVHALQEPGRTLFRRRRIGFVFQFFNLIPTLTVAENLALPLELIATPPAAVRQRTSDLLEAVGLPHAAGRFPDTLSGGEQQRIAVARALAHRPDLLLADEPTGNLDDATGELVTALLVSLAREHGTTMLIVTHSASVAQAADRVLQLHQGRLTAA